MPMYEVELLRPDAKAGEVRLTDQLLEVGTSVWIAGRRWRVQSKQPAQRATATARFVCGEATTGK